MEEPQQKQRSNTAGNRKVSAYRRRNPPGSHPHRRRNPLYRRCLLIRNLPKGFVGWSDLTDKNTPVRVRRIVYCEESHGSIMVEFMSEAECNTILTQDQQRKRKIRQRIHQEEHGEEINHNFQKLYAFEIMVTVERCSSERFVRSVLLGGSLRGHNPSRRVEASTMEQHNSESPDLLNGGFTDSATLTGMPPPSPLPSPSASSSSLFKRCIVIRKCSNPHNVEEDLQIPEAPAYERKVRAEDGSLRSEQPQIRPASPMEIRWGNLSEVVVRAGTLRSKANMMPAMVVELESEESVERILQQEESRRRIPNSEPATLAIPVEIHAVKSERYANICFGNTRTDRSNNSISSGRVNEDNRTLGSVDEESQMTADMSEIKDIDQNGRIQTNGEAATAFASTNEAQTQHIKNLEKEINVMRSEMGRLKALAARSDETNDKKADSDSPALIREEDDSTQNREQELLEERNKNKALEQHVRELVLENERLMEAESARTTSEDNITNTESFKEEQEELLTENENLKARIAEMETIASELEDAMAHQKVVEEARNKLEEENTGLLRYVKELQGHRSGKTIKDEERYKELEKKHSDLSTLYRFVKAQADQSAKELRKTNAEKNAIKSELRGFKMAWKNRVETQRQLEQSKNNEENYVCIECETVQFTAMLEEFEENDNGGAGANAEAGLNDRSASSL